VAHLILPTLYIMFSDCTKCPATAAWVLPLTHGELPQPRWLLWWAFVSTFTPVLETMKKLHHQRTVQLCVIRPTYGMLSDMPSAHLSLQYTYLYSVCRWRGRWKRGWGHRNTETQTPRRSNGSRTAQTASPMLLNTHISNHPLPLLTTTR